MFYQVKTVNGQKTKIPLSDPTPTGNPIGTIISTYKKIQPKNYLYCDGSFFDETIYPALYFYLGSNQLPDYRECVQVGAEQNTTDTIASHDVYTQGQFKDDQFQDHAHYDWNQNPGSGETVWAKANVAGYYENISTGGASSGRTGDTTHGKQKAVYYYIKAVDGVDISDEDTFLNTVKNYVDGKNSYSTDEVLTGGTWIDGKPIYRKAGHLDSVTIGDDVLDSSLTSSVVDTIISAGGCAQDGSGVLLAGMAYSSADFRLAIGCDTRGLYKLNVLSGIYTNFNWWIEYTKK